MKRRRFLIPSLLAAGFGGHDSALAAISPTIKSGTDDPDAGNLLRQFSQDHDVTLASHSSHSSHSSHASHSSGYGGGGHYSHTSHRSGAGGYDGGYSPVPSYTPSPPSPAISPTIPDASPATPTVQPLFDTSNRAAAPPPDGLPALSGRTKRFASIVRRVQLALLAQDCYSGVIDGVVGPKLRAALRKFQKERGLDVTGTITPVTLDALMVSSQ